MRTLPRKLGGGRTAAAAAFGLAFALAGRARADEIPVNETTFGLSGVAARGGLSHGPDAALAPAGFPLARRARDDHRRAMAPPR